MNKLLVFVILLFCSCASKPLQAELCCKILYTDNISKHLPSIISLTKEEISKHFKAYRVYLKGKRCVILEPNNTWYYPLYLIDEQNRQYIKFERTPNIDSILLVGCKPRELLITMGAAASWQEPYIDLFAIKNGKIVFLESIHDDCDKRVRYTLSVQYENNTLTITGMNPKLYRLEEETVLYLNSMGLKHKFIEGPETIPWELDKDFAAQEDVPDVPAQPDKPE